MLVQVKRKACKDASGQSIARMRAAPGVTDMGASQVALFTSAQDVYGIPSVLSVVAMSTGEARDLAAALIKAAEAADAQAAKDPTPGGR